MNQTQHSLAGRTAARWVEWRRTATWAAGLLLVLSVMLGGVTAQAQSDGAEASKAKAIPAARAAKKVVIITIDEQDGIDRYTLYSVKQRLEDAAASGADAVVIEIDSPGGELKPSIDISQLIKSSPIANTVAWIHPNAFSGGAVIALACREVIVSKNATLGDALIIGGSMFDIINGLPEAERQKFLIPLLVEVTDSARLRGFDEMLVQGIVSTGVELWLVERVDDPTQRAFITPSEYRAVFGQDPPQGMTPAIASVGQKPGKGGTHGKQHGAHAPPISPGESLQSDTEKDESAFFEEPERPARMKTARTSEEGSTEFTPAESIPSETAEAVSMGLELHTHRPNFADSAQKGQWRLVSYVSSGRGLVTLKQNQIIEYGLATQTVDSDDELKAYFGATELVRLRPSWSVSMVRFLTNPIIRGVLIVLFLLGMFIEMVHPGVILPGSVAACALVALLMPPALVDMATWWEIAAILIGIVLLGLELFVIPGFGIAGVAGVLLLFGGLVGTFVGPSDLFDGGAAAQSGLITGITTLLLSGLVAGVLMYFIGKNFGSLPVMRKLILTTKHGDRFDDEDNTIASSGGTLLGAMGEEEEGMLSIGTVGTVVTTLRPSGKISVNDRIYDVVSEGGIITTGKTVRVVSADKFRVGVELVDGTGGSA